MKKWRLDAYLEISGKWLWLAGLCAAVALGAWLCLMPKTCALCQTQPCHAVCLVDVTEGTVHPLTVYDPDPFRPGALAAEQTGGTFSLLCWGAARGYRDTARYVCSINVPAEGTGRAWGHFCRSCRRLLKENAGAGYALADIRTPETPRVMPLADGARYCVRCYQVDVCLDAGAYCLTVTGTLEQTGGADRDAPR